jgi:glycosyltransferase involved in cell wall biosynthesis
MRDKRRELVPLLLRSGRGARIVECTHFLIEYPSLMVPLWVILKRLQQFDWVKIVHDGSLPSRYNNFNFFRRALFRIAIGSVSEFIVLNEEMEQWIRKEIGVKQEVSIIKSLFPVSFPDEKARLPAELESALGPFLRRSIKICSIGVFIPEYGFEHVAEAVQRLRDETGEDIGLVLLDGDFATDEEYKAAVLNKKDWIVVLKNVPHQQVLQILKRCDVFVRGFGLDSYGLSRVEAIWCGLPVVATRAGETRGMLLYDYGNVDELTAQLKRALSGEHAHETLAWAARYRREAEENLLSISTKIGIDTQSDAP